MEKYYTVKEIADLLEISQYRVRRLIHIGLLKAERGPRRMFLVRESYLFAYAYHGPKYRYLLSVKIGPRFNAYMNVRNLILSAKNIVKKNPDIFNKILQRKAEGS